MKTYPLIAHRTPEQVIAYRNGKPISAARFLSDVVALAERLPAGSHVLNACADRYHFTVGLAAILWSGRISLLPSTHTPEAIRELVRFASDAICLSDTSDNPIALPQFVYPLELDDVDADASAETARFQVPEIDAARTVAFVFTSGSTGVPVAHRKTWGSLVLNVRAAAARLGIDATCHTTLIGTVPPQHMYGFESTVLLPLISGNAFHAGKPFYPADVVMALEQTPRPRALVSTPVHLRSLLAAGGKLPAADLLLCATAPLSRALAIQAEAGFSARLLEVYGSTETGQIATRRTAMSEVWELIGAVKIDLADQFFWASGGHIEQPTQLGDVIELLENVPGTPRSFLLHGRAADMINIAGKRSSIGYLNHQVNAIPGVVDASFYMPDDDQPDVVTRLSCFIVAPTLDAAAVTKQLRERVDAVFLPRPLIFLDALPRNDAGKLPRDTLRALLETHLARRGNPASPSADAGNAAASGIAAAPGNVHSWVIAADHPALAGHFPGQPVVPGVLLLDEALHAIALHYRLSPAQCELGQVKLLSPVSPGERLSLQHTLTPRGHIEFEVQTAGRVVARGSATLCGTAAQS
jgi:acyl-coenzyme A synthetase/AMP-(fatty) acid ligase